MWFPYSLFPIQTTSLFLPRRCLFLCGWCKDTKWKAIGRSQVCFYVFFSVFPWWFSEQAINRRMLVFLGMYSVLLEPIQLGFCFKRKEINQNPQSNTAIFYVGIEFFCLIFIFLMIFSSNKQQCTTQFSCKIYQKNESTKPNYDLQNYYQILCINVLIFWIKNTILWIRRVETEEPTDDIVLDSFMG